MLGNRFLEVMRQPMEDKVVTTAGVHPQAFCESLNHQKRISGPMPDRIDFYIEVLRVDYEKLSGDRLGETNESIRRRVQTTRDIQNRRYSSIRNSNIVCNADMRVGEVRQFCQ